MNKYLVTGVAGFIGMHVAKNLLINGKTVIGVDNLNDYYDPNYKKRRLNELINFPNFSFIKIDISNTSEINKLFTREKISHVILLKHHYC